MSFPVKKLIQWYRLNKRDLPWRKTADTYKIWLSEVMLQQTQVITVIPYYHRFIENFPTIGSLAKAKEQDVLKLWEGLGYYNRCHNFFQAAKHVMMDFNGRIPDQPAEFKKLPGVGPYIQAAVMSIAYGHPIPTVDGNVIRVIARCYGIRDDTGKGATRKEIHNILTHHIPHRYPGDFNQAMMELGARICVPRSPQCDLCPLNKRCIAFKTGQTESIPKRTAKPKIPVHRVSIAIISEGDRFLIQKRPSKGHLAGMWEFPGGKAIKDESAEQALIRECLEELNIFVKVMHQLKIVNHTYTHFKIKLHPFLCEIQKGRPKPMKQQPIKWITMDKIEQYPFPGANHKFFPELRKYLNQHLGAN